MATTDPKIATQGQWEDLVSRVKANAYTLPTASASTLGGIKVGENLSIDASTGVLSAAGGSTYTAGDGITIENDVISADIKPADFFTADGSTSVSGSAIDIENTANLPVSDLTIKGDTKQNQYTGANLLNESSITVTGTSGDWTYTNGIISCTPLTSSASVNVHPSFTTISLSANDTVYISCDIRLTSGSATFVKINDATVNFTEVEAPILSGEFQRYIFSHTYTSAKNLSMALIQFISLTNAVVEIKNIMVSKNNVSYEPYVGEAPAPSPDYPQGIHTVTGEQTINVAGKNLFSTTLEQGGLSSANGSEFDSVERIRTDGYINVNENTMYSYSTGTSGLQVCVFYYQSDGTYLNFSDWQNLPANITTIENASKIKISYRKSSQDDITPSEVSNVQVELGSTATAYEPYIGKEYKVNLGKNLFDKDAEADYLFNVTVAPTQTGIRVTSPTGSSTATNYHYGIFSLFPVSNYVGKTLTLSVGSINASTAGNGQVAIVLCDADGSNASIVGDTALTESNSHSSYTVASGNTGKHIGLIFYAVRGVVSPANSYVDYTNVQLEVGSTATTYAPYFTPIELCKIGDYQDYIYSSDGDWYLHKETNKLIANGTENWTEGSSGRKDLLRPDAVLGSSSNNPILSDKYTPRFALTNNSVFLSGTYRQISIVDTVNATSVAAWKTWLSNNNTTFYYAIATPTETKITNESLIKQLNNLKGMDTYKDYTSVIVVPRGSNAPATLGFTAYKNSLAGVTGAISSIEVIGGSSSGGGSGTITEVQANGTSVATSGVANIPAASTSAYGVTQLTNSTSSTSTTTAATPSSVKSAYDLANGKATITMTTTDPGEGAALAAGRYTAVYGMDGVFGNYSTSELDTGAKWIDGKKIYKKTIYFSSLATQGNLKTIAHGISGMSATIKYEGLMSNSGGTAWWDLSYAGAAMEGDKTNISVYSYTMDLSSYKAYVTIYYTKSN